MSGLVNLDSYIRRSLENHTLTHRDHRRHDDPRLEVHTAAFHNSFIPWYETAPTHWAAALGQRTSIQPTTMGVSYSLDFPHHHQLVGDITIYDVMTDGIYAPALTGPEPLVGQLNRHWANLEGDPLFWGTSRCLLTPLHQYLVQLITRCGFDHGFLKTTPDTTRDIEIHLYRFQGAQTTCVRAVYFLDALIESLKVLNPQVRVV